MLSTLSKLISEQQVPESVSVESWSEIIRLALENNVGPKLWWVVRKSGMDTSDPMWKLLRLSTLKAAAHYMALEHAAAEVEKTFREAGIPAVWLKGFGLGRTVYPEPYLRTMVDLDVLVPYEARSSALKLAQSLGYRFPESPDIHSDLCEGLYLKVNHHYQLERGVGQVVILEIHFRLLHARGLLSPEGERWFWNQTQVIEHAAVSFRIHKPEADLLYLTAHSMLQDGEAGVDLLHFFDLHLLINRSDLDWDLIVEKAISLRWASAVERALTLIVQLFKTPVPVPVFQRLQQGRLPDEDVLQVSRLRGTGYKWEMAKRRYAGLSLAESLRWAAQVIFPPLTYMRYHHQIPERGLVWPHYLIRWFNQASHVQAWVRMRLAEKLAR